MAKMNMTVDNKLEDIKLKNKDEMSKKSRKDEKKKIKEKKKDNESKKGRLKEYFLGIGKEMKMVSWPSRKSLVKYSLSTISMIIFLAFFFIIISTIFDLLYGLAQGWLG